MPHLFPLLASSFLLPEYLRVSLGVGLPSRTCNLQHACVCRNVRAASTPHGLGLFSWCLACRPLWPHNINSCVLRQWGMHVLVACVRQATVTHGVLACLNGSLEECMWQGAGSSSARCCIVWLATAVCNSVWVVVLREHPLVEQLHCHRLVGSRFPCAAVGTAQLHSTPCVCSAGVETQLTIPASMIIAAT